MNHIRLFQANLIQCKLGELSPIPEAHLNILLRWLTAFKSAQLNNIKEVSLHGELLTDLFGHVLGYNGITSAVERV